MKTTVLSLLMSICLFAASSAAREYHVATTGDDSAPGAVDAPLRTIQEAANRAMPGDVVTVHEGVYRERIDPPRGGEGDDKRIVYQAASGAKVVIKGSEVVKGWEKVAHDTWKVVLPNSFFGDFNPYADEIRGDWFKPLGRKHHTGAVYLEAHWLVEAAAVDEVMKPVGNQPLWFGSVDAEHTTIHAQLPGIDPNADGIEINIRSAVFYPSQTGRNYITVRGFIMEHAATNWAPPTAEQVGLIGTHWSNGWIIENNTIRYSVCSGVTLGKYGDEFDNKSASSSEGYLKTIERARTFHIPWTKEHIGHHVVRDNTIAHCEQAGIVGSLGCAFSTITGNKIHDIHMRRHFSGAEMAGIKFHGAIDAEVSHNLIFRTKRALWLDWMAQGTLVIGNCFHDNAVTTVKWSENWDARTPGGEQDMFLEVNHGPILVANNLFLSPYTINMRSQGVAFVHNLIAGAVRIIDFDDRQTPSFEPHSTIFAGLHNTPAGDVRFYNNLFTGAVDLSGYDTGTLPVTMAGNVFLKGAKPSRHETSPVVLADFDPAPRLREENGVWFLDLKAGWSGAAAGPMVTSELLGKTKVSGQAFVSPDGSPIQFDRDLPGEARTGKHPSPGPFESLQEGSQSIQVWPRKGK